MADLVLSLLDLPDGTLLAGGPGGIARLSGDSRTTEWVRVDSPIRTVATFARGLVDGSPVVLAGGVDGVARSENGGLSWQGTETEGGTQPVAALVVHDDAAIAGTLGGGILRSTDAGRTWQRSNFGLPSHDVTALLMSGTTVIAGTPDGVYWSPNAGRAWRVAMSSAGKSVAGLASTPGDAAVAVTEAGELLCSSDDGRTWRIMKALPDNVLPVALAITDDTVCVVATAEHGILGSRLRGEGITRSPDVAALALLRTGPDSRSPRSGTGTRLIAGGPDGLAVSRDSGATWHSYGCPALDDLDNTIAVPGGELRWGRLSGMIGPRGALEGLPLPLMAVALTPDGGLLISSAAGLWRSPDLGESWRVVLEGDTGRVHHLAFRADGTGWAGDAEGGRLMHTEDHGESWQQTSVPWAPARLLAMASEQDVIGAMTADPARGIATVWYCDRTRTWTPAGPPLQ